MLRIGYHVSISGSMDLAFDRAREIGCTAMQIFPSNPRGWEIKALGDGERKNFIEKSKKFDIRPIVAHMPYLPNLSSPKKPVYEKSKKALKLAIERCNTLGIQYLVLHLGSSLGEPKQDGIRNAADAVAAHIDSIAGCVLLEDQAGTRNSVGSELEDLVSIRDRIASKKVGFCFDTCHAFAAGYDVRSAEVLDRIGKVLGDIQVVHLNDAKYGLGSHRDRHENLGLGYIGKEGLKAILSHKGFRDKPLIMETPFNPLLPLGYEIGLVRKLINHESG